MFNLAKFDKSISYRPFRTVGLNFISYYTEKIGIREQLCIKSDTRSSANHTKCCSKSVQTCADLRQKSGLEVIQKSKSQGRWLPHAASAFLDKTVGFCPCQWLLDCGQL